MSIGEYVRGILNRGKKVQRLKFEDLYEKMEYQKTFSLASEHEKVPGVKESSDELMSVHNEYMKQMRQMEGEELETEKSKYTIWEKIHKGKVAGKWTAIAMIVALILSFLIQTLFLMSSNVANNICGWVQLFMFLLFFVGLASGIVLKICEMICGGLYESYTGKLREKARKINNGYIANLRSIGKNIDNLYLNSLSPEERRFIIGQREAERRHKEMLYQQEMTLRQQEIRDEVMMKEMRESKKVQEKLLEIEQERERRRNRW